MVDTTSASVEPKKNDETMTASPAEATKPADGENVENCPLFMDGLPTDFSTNPGLAALASLLDDNTDEACPKVKESDTPAPWAGGGKVRRKPSRSKRNDGPYRRDNDRQKGDATIGEASLFLKMWKL
jgi:hypothetical protein